MLQLPTDSLEMFEKGFQILEDWAHNISFDGEDWAKREIFDPGVIQLV